MAQQVKREGGRGRAFSSPSLSSPFCVWWAYFFSSFRRRLANAEGRGEGGGLLKSLALGRMGGRRRRSCLGTGKGINFAKLYRRRRHIRRQIEEEG